MNKNNVKTIYKKISDIQCETTELFKDNYNKFQNYKYFTEYQCLSFLKPQLKKNELALIFEDVPELGYKCEKEEKEYRIEYWKQATIHSTDSEEKVVVRFLALGKNIDIAKAKGSAETYAVKYFLQKFFLLPQTDNLDPDRDQQFSKPQSSSSSAEIKEPAGAKVLCSICKNALSLVKVKDNEQTYFCSTCKKEVTRSINRY